MSDVSCYTEFDPANMSLRIDIFWPKRNPWRAGQPPKKAGNVKVLFGRGLGTANVVATHMWARQCDAWRPA